MKNTENEPQHTITEDNRNTQEEHHLIIDGASCASCVSKIEKALRTVDGVQSADMNFAQRSVIVIGHVKDVSLITAIEIAGYNAKVDTSGSEEEALDEKDKAEWWFWIYKSASVTMQDGAIEILVKDGVYQPSKIRLPANQKATLSFTRLDSSPCSESLQIPDLDINASLTLNKKVDVTIPPTKPGRPS